MSKNNSHSLAKLFSLLIIIGIIAGRLLLDERYIDGVVIGKDRLLKDFSWVSDLSKGSVPTGFEAQIHILDVGQGDAIYIKVSDWDILIDAGSKSESGKLLSQLSEFNIDDFEMVIATHPHEDHIGGMPAVFESYKVKGFYMPEMSHTTKSFADMIKSVQKEKCSVTKLMQGFSIPLNGNASISIYNPVAGFKTDNLNNYSPIIKVKLGNISAVLAGDAEADIENEVLDKFYKELDADIFKASHHGSDTSNTEEFLTAISPKYSVISVGENNSYGHPNKKILKRLKNSSENVYRTDENGRVSFYTDGNLINVKTEK